MDGPTFAIEVITVPVSDVDRSLQFYADQVGFAVDVDYAPNDEFRVVQLTPAGSSCSIQIGTGLSDAKAGSVRSVYLVVNDLAEARRALMARGVEVSDIRHKAPADTWAGRFAPGLNEQRKDYASFADFADPDGNRWILQERGFREA